MKLLNVDYVGAELVKDLQNGCVFKSKKERDNLNPYGRDSLNHYFSLVLTIDNHQGELLETNSIKERKFINEHRADYSIE